MTCNQEARDALERAVAESRRAVELSNNQYRQGLVSFQSVLDTQRQLFELEDRLASQNASITSDLIALYKALGGGWQLRQGKHFVAEAIRLRMAARTDWGSLLEEAAPFTVKERPERRPRRKPDW